jgi:hypothetical protein
MAPKGAAHNLKGLALKRCWQDQIVLGVNGSLDEPTWLRCEDRSACTGAWYMRAPVGRGWLDDGGAFNLDVERCIMGPGALRLHSHRLMSQIGLARGWHLLDETLHDVAALLAPPLSFTSCSD